MRYSIETHGVQDGIEGGAAATPQRGARVRATIESRPQAELAQLRSSRVDEGRTMLMSLCFSALLLGDANQGATLAPPPAAATGDAAAMLKEKLAKLSELKSYTFEALDDGAGMGGRGGRGGRRGGGEGGGGGDAGGAPPAPTPTVGKVEIGKGVELTRGESLAYRRDTKMVYKKGDAWELYTAPEFGGGAGGGRRGGGGEAGGGAGGPPAGGGAGGGAPGGPGGGGGDMRERFAMMGLASQVLPHELLTGMHGKLKDLTCSEANGGCTISGALNQEAADEFSGAKRIKEMFAGGGGFGGAGGGAGGAAGGAGGEISASGTATITFDAAGMPTQIVIETTMTTARGDSKRKQSYTLKAFGATTIEVPKEAAAKLAG